jgi:threonine aldolase
MVYLTLQNEIPFDARQVAFHLKEKDILVGVVGLRRFRLVTHYWIDSAAVAQTVDAFQKVLQSKP